MAAKQWTEYRVYFVVPRHRHWARDAWDTERRFGTRSTFDGAQGLALELLKATSRYPGVEKVFIRQFTMTAEEVKTTDVPRPK